MLSRARMLTCFCSCLVLPGCTGTRSAQEPSLLLRTAGGVEQGVSTPYGVVFLGRTARAGRVEIEVRYGDGPSIETSVIEPVGGGLYTAETEIRLPTVPLTFDRPEPGDDVVLMGYGNNSSWKTSATVRTDERVFGLLLDVPRAFEGEPERLGCGVYLEDGEGRLRLLGLVSGRLTLEGTDGMRSYLTVLGPDTLWRLVTHRRDHNRRKPWVYREDIR